jgi:peptidoglycan/xylan/chitin deacetylase (PgdA/CDA1 family)
MSASLKKTLKSFSGRVAGFTGAYAREFRSKLVVVAFHRVTDELPEDDLTCGSEKFETFCRFFQKHFRVMALSDQIAGCRAGADLGGTLSITFDDGYRDNYEVAAPILQRLHLPAAFFVTTGYIGTDTVAPWDRQLLRRPGWMSWEQVRSLANMGFEIGSHTDTHIDLGTADADTVRAELATSQRKLAAALGKPVRLFAYPFGGREHISPGSRELVRAAGFECCIACYGGLNSATPDPFNLNRIGIAEWFASPHQLGFEMVTGKA